MTEIKKDPLMILEEADPAFCDQIVALPGGENIRKCFACGTCTAGCPISNVDETYSPRKLIRQILFGLRDEVLQSPVIWYCLTCYRCSARCPQEVNFSDLMRAIRHLAVQEGHAPSEILAKGDAIDRATYLIRRDLVKNTIEGRNEALLEIEAKLNRTEQPEHGK